MKLIFFTLTVAAACCLVAARNENESIQKYLEKLENSGYNTNVKPTSIKGPGEPIDVVCSMFLNEVHKVDDVNMDFKASFYFLVSWNDSRLAYPDEDIRTVVLNDVKHIWTPDLFLVEEKEGIRHSIITPNEYVRISKTGTVRFGTKVTIVFTCPMDFAMYPHDTHKCFISIESFGHSRSDFELSWNVSVPVQRMYIDVLPYRIISMKEDVIHVALNTGNYSRLYVELTFQRKLGFFVTRLYIPFIFLTVLTWLSFWIPAKLFMPRLSLLLVVMYIMVHIGHEINAKAPMTSYTKGSDVWIAVCESLVFGAFLEFIVVHIIGRNKDKFQKRLGKNNPEAMEALEKGAKQSPVNNETSSNTVSLMVASRVKCNVLLLSGHIEGVSSIPFPALFVGFNFIYWLVYCTEH